QMFSSGVPVANRSSHGAPSTSTNVSASSLRQTNEVHSACSVTRNRPTSSHFAAVEVSAAAIEATSSTGPAASAAAQPPQVSQSGASAASTSTASAAASMTGTTRHSSIAARASLRRSGGSYVRLLSEDSIVRRSGIGGAPSHDEPFLALRGA